MIQTVEADENGDLTNLGAGIYNVEITDANGCQDQLLGIIIESPDELEVYNSDESLQSQEIYGGYGISCNGESDGSIEVTITGGSGGYIYDIIYEGSEVNLSEGQITELVESQP